MPAIQRVQAIAEIHQILLQLNPYDAEQVLAVIGGGMAAEEVIARIDNMESQLVESKETPRPVYLSGAPIG